MARHQAYRKLMEGIAIAHREFSDLWNKKRAEELKKICPHGQPSYEQIWHANGIAYRAADEPANRRNQLLTQLLEQELIPLWPGFSKGAAEDVDAVIDFLETDVPAFRCGYLKESYLRALKRIPLNAQHMVRLRQLGIELCRRPHHRREIREAGRLMIRVADRDFVETLGQLASSGGGFVTKKAARMLNVVLNGRPDLRARPEVSH